MSDPHATAPVFEDPAGTWNRRFSAPGYLFGTEPNPWLHEHATLWEAGQRVLCVADGEGRNSVFLAQQGLTVDAFDISEVGVRKARDFARITGVKVNFAVADIAQLQWPKGLYDGVVAIFIQFADPVLRARIFEGMVRSLKPGGLLVLQGYTPKQLDYRTGGPPFAAHMYTEPLLREAFTGMEIVDLREYETELAEGTGHRGHSAVIGLVARKPA
ncbi:class I SAM-dependent methyltransferase [Ramlibacter sp. USB13]|uniref:Class I SAM-dependent methyltransferase n=1 Tax=Ramlibacter cellulosilyticus TaxID=2764187 RepID=A0A923MP02_9BURK|nr:class I SAM-dependent methyltransferase [Ramlibacter cellulosilyticus]MBC5782176.1 class I SAM-dependent methyltransferase [Ramlibacter cellulosilyticus]